MCTKLSDQLIVNNPFIAGRKNDRIGSIGTTATWTLFCDNILQDPDFVRDGYAPPSAFGIQKHTQFLVEACMKRKTQTGEHDATEYPETLINACMKIEEFNAMTQHQREKRLEKEERDKRGGAALQQAAFVTHQKKRKSPAWDGFDSDHEAFIVDDDEDDGGDDEEQDAMEEYESNMPDNGGAPLTATGADRRKKPRKGNRTKNKPRDELEEQLSDLMGAAKQKQLARAASEPKRAEARLIQAKVMQTMMAFMTERMGN
jgi:hypothetical protein